MGIFQKVKNILFDEEEDYTSQIKITPEMRSEDIEEKEVKIQKEEKQKVEKPVVEETKNVEQTSERELFKSDTTFPFFDFDEKEFNNQKPVVPVKKEEEKKIETRNINVYEYEKRKRTEKRTDFGRYERTEITETVERKKFKPSPIISPVYGVLNQDYKKDDIIKREDKENLTVEKVRNKAFGEKTKEEEKKIEPKVTHYEDEETVTITIPEEKERKVKTIDELLEDTSDIIVDLDRDLTSDLDYEEESNNISEEIEDNINIDDSENDTLENDLFDLIDSMYDNSEDGE